MTPPRGFSSHGGRGLAENLVDDASAPREGVGCLSLGKARMHTLPWGRSSQAPTHTVVRRGKSKSSSQVRTMSTWACLTQRVSC